MRNLWVLVFVILIVAILAAIAVSFQVRETEKALVTRFGKPTRTIDEPGWNWRWPAPIETVHKFDSRCQLFEGIMEETTTKGGETIIVTSYLIWKIADPKQFLEAVYDKTGAEEQLRNVLRNTQNEIIGEHSFSEFVNSDPEKIHLDDIEKKMFADIKDQARSNYGIDVKCIGIKKLAIDEDVTKEVFERMKADRNRKTQTTLEQGNAEATRIRSDAEKKRTVLLAVVEARAKAIRGQGDAEAAKYYKLLDEDPDFAIFLSKIDALKKILKEKSTIILGGDIEPIDLIKKAPDIKPKDLVLAEDSNYD